MSIIVLKRGTHPGPQVYLGTCTKCTTEVQFLRTDAFHVGFDHINGTHACVNCPVCDQTIVGTPKK